MSEYSLMRLKKNAEMQYAISSVRKDLYEWKSSSASSTNNTKIRPAPSQRLKSIEGKTSSLKRSDSMKDLDSKTNSAAKSLLTRTQSSQLKLTDLDVEDVNINDLGESDEKLYLNSARNSSLLAVRKTQPEIEADLALKLDNNSKDPKTVYEMDLSQYNLKSIKNLQKFPNLKFLDYSCNQITKLEHLKFKNLIELRLYANQIEVLENLDNLFELQSLQLQANRIKRLNKGLNNLRKLEYLRLDQNQLEAINIGEISSCANLIYLNISHNKIESLIFINCLSNLEELDASYLNLKKLDDIDANRCKRLTELDLSNNYLSDENFSSLENLSSLNTLKAANNKLKTVRVISNIKALKNLDVSHNQIELIEDLKKLKDLECLDVSNNKINQWNQIEKLVLCNQLVELQFLNNPIWDENAVKNALYRLPSLKIINEISIDDSSNSKSQQQAIQQSNLAKDMIIMQVDLQNFQQEMEIFNQSFLKKFDDLKQTLSSIVIENEPNYQNADKLNAKKTSGMPKKTSKTRLIDALNFSKQLN